MLLPDSLVTRHWPFLYTNGMFFDFQVTKLGCFMNNQPNVNLCALRIKTQIFSATDPFETLLLLLSRCEGAYLLICLLTYLLTSLITYSMEQSPS